MPIAGERFHELYQNANEPDAQLVFTTDEMISILLEKGLARKRSVPPKRVGIHKSNREGLGVVDESVHGIGMDIHTDGFVWKAVAEACAFEDDDAGTNAAFTCAICNDDKSLATYVEEEIEIVSVACTHTNQFLAAAIDGVETIHDAIATNGKISSAKLAAANPNIAKALKDGLEWTIISKKVPLEYPEFPSLVQRAKNKVGMTQRRPDMWQALTFMARMMSRLAKSNDNFIDWGAIIHQTILSSPPVPASIPAYADFLKLYGTDTYVDELSQFARKYCKVGTYVPGALFQAIANLRCSPSE